MFFSIMRAWWKPNFGFKKNTKLFSFFFFVHDVWILLFVWSKRRGRVDLQKYKTKRSQRERERERCGDVCVCVNLLSLLFFLCVCFLSFKIFKSGVSSFIQWNLRLWWPSSSNYAATVSCLLVRCRLISSLTIVKDQKKSRGLDLTTLVTLWCWSCLCVKV